jgi:ankyrin repeat protein
MAKEWALFQAARYGRGDAIHILCANGADPNAVLHVHGEGNFNPLHYAVARGAAGADAVAALVTRGANVNGTVTGDTPLNVAIRNGNENGVRALLAAHADTRQESVGGRPIDLAGEMAELRCSVDSPAIYSFMTPDAATSIARLVRAADMARYPVPPGGSRVPAWTGRCR